VNRGGGANFLTGGEGCIIYRNVLTVLGEWKGTDFTDAMGDWGNAIILNDGRESDCGSGEP